VEEIVTPKEHRKKVLVIAGPTCSGKTTLAIEIAKRSPAEIVSADSRQIYRRMDIGTAKPSNDILGKYTHHFINIVNPGQEYNAGEYGRDARKTIDEIFTRSHLPIVVGGSGLYIRSLIDGLFEGAGKDNEIRLSLEKRLEIEGAEKLLDELHSVDPGATMTLKTLHRRRLVRALEAFYVSGLPLSQLHAMKPSIQFHPEFVGLRWDRKQLYSMIDNRVNEMMDAGLLQEVQSLYTHGFDDSLQSLNTPGYKELFSFLRNEISMERAIELIKQHTRNYAKRQITWFNVEKRMRWFDMQTLAEIEQTATSINNEIMFSA